MLPADLNRLAEVSDPQLSPDGNDIAYVVTTADIADDKPESHIWLAHWDGAVEHRLTGRPGESETRPRYAPNGKFLLFLSSRTDAHGHDQLWRLPRAGGEADKITDLPGGVDDFAIAPDSDHVAVVAPDPDPADTARTPRPIVIDRYQFKEDGEGYLTSRRRRLYLLSLADRKPARLTTGDYDEYLPAFAPDGKTIAFVSKRQPDPDRSDNFNIYVTSAQPGAPLRALTTSPGANDDPDWDSPPAFSPDGKKIAYLQGGAPNMMSYGVHELAIVPTEGGQATVPVEEIDRNISHPVWSRDGNTIDCLLEDDGAVRLIAVDLPTANPTGITSERLVVTGFSQAAGRTVVAASTPMHPAEIFAEEGPWLRRLTTHNSALVTSLDFGSVEPTTFKSGDGTEIHGFVVTPPPGAQPARNPSAQPGQKLPAILRLHGGPQAQFQMQFYAEWQILAGAGYEIIAANPRGSSGRGEDFSSAIYADWGHKDAEDVLAAVDDAVLRHNADPLRLGIGGWSYGAMLTDYVIAQDKRFHAAIAGAGIANVLAGYGTDEYVRDYETEFGRPWENLAQWEKVSVAFLHNDRIVTPTLFLGGESDFNVPLLNSEQMYEALRSRGIPTELVIYPGASHRLTRPSFLVDRMQRYVSWYDRFLKQ
jgi:dipeptidyl aminopeptidase/acylaminoacyl peptidase